MITNIEKYTTVFEEEKAQLLSTEPFLNGNTIYATSQLLFLTILAPTDLPGDITLAEFISFTKGLDLMKCAGGAYSRAPDRTENTSVDDYLALTCSKLTAQEVLASARHQFGFLDIHYFELPGFNWSQFIFRFQGLWQHMKLSAGERLGFLGQLIWATSVIVAARKPFSNQDSWIQTHLMCEVYRQRSFKTKLMDFAYNYFFKKKGTKTTSEIFAEYCQIPDHPLVQAWKPYN